jgi:hypothetical protein
MIQFMIFIISIIGYLATVCFAYGFISRYCGYNAVEPENLIPAAFWPVAAAFWPVALVCFCIYYICKHLPLVQFGDRFAQYLMAPRPFRVENIQRTADEHTLHQEAMQEVEETLDQFTQMQHDESSL